MKSLIIGADGFVGYHLINELKKIKGNQVFGTYLNNFQSISKEIESFRLDVTSQLEFNKLITLVKPDVIIHLAAQSSVKNSWEEPLKTFDVNVGGVINLLNSVKLISPSSTVLLIGSSEEYGKVSESDNPIRENFQANPLNIYAVSKVSQNYIGKIYSQTFGLKIVMTRSFNHFGPGQDSSFVISDFCKQIVKMEHNESANLLKVGNLDSLRDFTDVRDIVTAYVGLLNKGVPGETYNIGSGKAVSVRKLLDVIVSHAKITPIITIDKSKFRPIDTPIIVANVDKLKSIINWQPKYSVNETILDMLTYWRNKLKEEKLR
jgi:GDP-4-dehydro-6-deoxy-D-mannose reductase